MFERYTEKARRVIFFSRYEAGTLGSPFIGPEHLLLGLLRECAVVRILLKTGAAEALRGRLLRESGGQPKIAANVDLPMSLPATRALAYAAEEAERLHEQIECGHMLAGILRLDEGIAFTFLQEEFGDLDQLLESVRKRLRKEPDPPSASRGLDMVEVWLDEAGEGNPDPEFAKVHQDLWRVLSNAFEVMDRYTAAYGNARLHRRPWTRKQALGYLIDWASQYRLWLGRALTEPNLRADRPPTSEDAAILKQYELLRWQFLVESWLIANCFLLNTIAILPGAKATIPCRIGIADSIPLVKLLAGFVEMTEDIMEQILARLA
ncbi:MAG TPA: Clp protease N-terminal domain-containing protein [Bryobacteraceae bacterium]|nr:Clp protease N-terminal domain-containing protein [Bryobacteraceae bacterium]